MNPARAKLLIVDESEPARSHLREKMHDLGFVMIDEVSDAHEALSLVRDHHFEVVLCEWNHSAFTGIDLVRAVRRAPEGRDLPVVLIGDVSAKRTVEALEAGANGLLAKPVSESRLAEKVMRIVASLPPPADLLSAPSPIRRDDTRLHSR